MTQSRARKLILVGIDSMMIKRIDRFAAEGRLPVLSRLTANGVSACAYPTIPTSTGPNWTTIITGADSMTHGVFSNNFDSSICKAERIWQVAEREGLKSIILRFPGGWPPTVRDGIVMEFGGPANSPWNICYSKCYTTEHLTRFTGDKLTGPRIEPISLDLQPSSPPAAANAAPTPPPLGADLPMPTIRTGEAPALRLHVISSGSEGYDKVVITRKDDPSRVLACIGLNEWSPFITLDCIVEGETRAGTCRFKLLKLSPDARQLTLYRSALYSTDGFTYPPDLAGDLVSRFGPYFENPNRLLLALGWFDNYFEELEYHTTWLRRAARHLQQNHDWRLFFTQCHSPDYAEHEWLGGIDPMSGRYDPDSAKTWWDAFARDYEIMDKHIGEMTAEADDDTLVVVVSDHGHIMGTAKVEIANALEAAGLLKLDADGNVSAAESPVTIHTHGLVRVNLQGRDAEGIVPPGDFDGVCNRVADVLHAIRDSKTGRRPIHAVLRNHEAALLGFGGPAVPGDLFVIPAPGYTLNLRYIPDGADDHITRPDPRFGVWGGSEGTHAHLPSVDWSEGTIQSTFIIAGPGIKKGLRREKPIFLRDVAPTLAYLLGIPCPANADGRVLHDIIE